MLLYTTPNGKVKVEIYLQNETVWVPQQKIADLFGVDRTITEQGNNLAKLHRFKMKEAEIWKGIKEGVDKATSEEIKNRLTEAEVEVA